MSTLDSVSPGSPSSSQFIPLAKTERGWDAFKRLHQDNRPEFRPVKDAGSVAPKPLPQSGEAAEFLPVKPGQFGAFGSAHSLESRKDLFTGDELNPGLVQGKSPEAKELRAGEAAQKLVASTLVEPILKQVRETNNAAPPFGPTEAEKQFGPILDGQIAEKIVTAADFPLVERIKQDLLKSSAYVTQAEQASAPRHELTGTKPLDILG